jgi:alanine racemase
LRYSKLIVNLDNIKENIETLKRRQKDGCKIIAMVKANAYGLGMVEVSKFLEKEKLADYLGVAYIDEAIELNKVGILLPIVITCPGVITDIEEIVNYENVIPSVSDYEYAEALNNLCEKKNITKKVHIEINTGMNRFGVSYKDSIKVIHQILKLKNIQVDGIYTHFAAADVDSIYTGLQKERFDNLLDELKKTK